tara:strand:- start:1583 stop:2167 length:585 start_codon:yes stop_codon:yes gene_type:complete
MIKAYSVGLAERDYELIRKIVKIIELEHISIKDLRYYDIKLEEINKDDVLLVFGSKASRLVEDINAKQIVSLPRISSLHANTGSQAERLKAFNQLKLLKDILKTDEVKVETKTIIKDPFPEITISDLKTLETTLAEKNVNTWLTTTKNGKTIQLSITPSASEADMNITFSELYTLKIAADTLGVQEFTIIYSNV